MTKETSKKRIPIAKLDQNIRSLVETRANDKKITLKSYLIALFPSQHPPKDLDETHEEDAAPETPEKEEDVIVETTDSKAVEPGVLVADEPEPEPEPEEPKLDLDKVRRQASQTIDTCGPKKVMDALEKFGASKLSDLKEEDYQGFFDECEELLNMEGLLG